VSQAFKNYFWTAQIFGGSVMAAKMLGEGIKDSGWYGLLWGLGGFLAVIPIAAALAGLRTAYDLRQSRKRAQLLDPRELTTERTPFLRRRSS
jgi:hypothetical protein